LKQFDSTAEEEGRDQKTKQAQAIATDCKHPGDQTECCQMLNYLPGTGDRPLVGWDDRQNQNRDRAYARKAANNHQPPSHSITIS
jgi:hypothetical protein